MRSCSEAVGSESREPLEERSGIGGNLRCLPFDPCPGPLLDHAAPLRHHLEAFITECEAPPVAPRAQHSQPSSWPRALQHPAPRVALLNQTIPGANIISFWSQRLRPVRRCGLFYGLLSGGGEDTGTHGLRGPEALATLMEDSPGNKPNTAFQDRPCWGGPQAPDHTGLSQAGTFLTAPLSPACHLK